MTQAARRVADGPQRADEYATHTVDEPATASAVPRRDPVLLAAYESRFFHSLRRRAPVRLPATGGTGGGEEHLRHLSDTAQFAAEIRALL